MFVPTYVQRIGIELEGGWMQRFKDAEIVGDISVQRPIPSTDRKCTCDEGPHDGTCHWGEIASPPLPLQEGLAWMRDHYPDGINATCGLHVHASVRNEKEYAQLMDKGLHNLFVKRVKEWAEEEGLPKDHLLWKRLTSKETKAPDPARFCNRPFAAHEQVMLTTKTDTRRSILNFCYALHGTVECRLFPAFADAAQAARAILVYIKALEEWLRTRPVEKPEVAILKLREISKAREPFQILKT